MPNREARSIRSPRQKDWKSSPSVVTRVSIDLKH